MIRLNELDEECQSFFNGKEIEIIDAEVDFILVTCALDDLDSVSVNSFPKGLTILVSSQTGFETELFDEVFVSADGNEIAVEFECSIPNKFWNGFFGLVTYLDAVHEQVRKSNCFEVTALELEDNYKSMTVCRNLSNSDLIGPAVLDIAHELHMLEKAAKRALTNEAVNLFSNNE